MQPSQHIIDSNLSNETHKLVGSLQSKIIKTVNASPSRLKEWHAKSPQSYFVIRDHPLSEQKDDMLRKPVETGIRHADDWKGKLDSWKLPMVKEKRIVLGINEPPIWEGKQWIDSTNTYTVAFLDRLRQHGIIGGAFSINTGHPRSDGASPNWNDFIPIRDAILRGGHYLMIHEYWDKRGPQDPAVWGHNPGRFIRLCNWQVPVIVGECGLDQAISGGKHQGWKGLVSADLYAEHLRWYCNEIGKDKRFLGAVVFTEGGNQDWVTFTPEQALAKFPKNTDFSPVSIGGVPQPPPTPPPTVPEPPKPETPKMEWNMPAWTNFVPANVTAGQKYWRLTKAQFKDEKSSGGKHHIFLESGSGTLVGVNANGAVTKAAKDIPMYTNDAYRVYVEGSGAVASDNVLGLKMEPKNHHVSYHLWFELATAGSTTPQLPPPPTPPPPAPPSGNLSRILVDAGERNILIRFNPNAALQKVISADGFMPNSGEFEVTYDGVKYVAQRAEHLKTSEVRVYYCKSGDWDNVKYVKK